MSYFVLFTYLNFIGSLFYIQQYSNTSVGDSLFEKKRSHQTQVLYDKLLQIKGKGVFFGMKDATGYGVGWDNDNDESDVLKITGDYPALAGWGADYSICRIARGQDFKAARYKIQLFHEMGSFNTIDWHAENYYGANYMWKNHPDKSKNVVASILPGGENHLKFVSQLNHLASFFNSLIDKNGEKIPIIFRPWHEHSGDWFWWGASNCSDEEYIELWRFTVEYLSEIKGVDNLLYAFSPARLTLNSNYLFRYPGDKYIDILGLDNYWSLRENYDGFDEIVSQLKILVGIANAKNKPAAFTETGPFSKNGKAIMNEKDWYTNKLLKSILFDDITSQISYVMVWRNADKSHFHVPYPGHPAVPDFLQFYNHPFTLFLNQTK